MKITLEFRYWREKGNSFTVINTWGDNSSVEVSEKNGAKVSTKQEGNKYTFGTVVGKTYMITQANH